LVIGSMAPSAWAMRVRGCKVGRLRSSMAAS
jgi:hypothetical protein